MDLKPNPQPLPPASQFPAAASYGHLALSVPSAGTHRPPRPFRIEPEPDWIDAVPMALRANSKAPVALIDVQYRYDGQRPLKFERHVYRIRNAADQRSHARLKVEYDPAFNDLAFHVVRIYRSTRVLEKLADSCLAFVPEDSKTVHEAYGPPRTISTRRSCAMLTVGNLCIGDIVEIAYTMIGAGDPRLTNTLAFTLNLTMNRRVDRLRHRLLLAESEPTLTMRPYHTSVEPSRSQRDGWREYVWDARDVPAVEGERDPRKNLTVPHVALSCFPDWYALVHLTRPLYHRGEHPPEIDVIAAQIREAHETPRARALAALRHVQMEFAYSIANMDRYTVEPRPLTEVLAKRVGDCKSKSLLLVTLLAALDIAAEFVHVNLGHRCLPDALPDPSILDHVIVVANIEGTEVFMDTTRQGERGDFDTMPKLPYRWGLSQAPNRGLVPIPHACDEPEPEIESVAHYQLGAPGQPTYMRFRRINRRHCADDSRRFFLVDPPGALEQRMRASFGELHPNLAGSDRLRLRDDETNNHYHLAIDLLFDDVWQPDGTALRAAFTPLYLERELAGLAERPSALREGYCNRHVFIIRVELPWELDIVGGSFTRAIPGWSLTCTLERQESLLEVRYEMRTCGFMISDPNAAAEAFREAHRHLGFAVRTTIDPGPADGVTGVTLT